MLQTLFGFKGRLSRPGLWESLASIVLVDIAAILILKYIEAYGLPGGYPPGSALAGGIARAIPLVFSVLTVWALVATLVKRAHDRGRTGWLLLLAVIPVIGWIWLVVDLLVLGTREGRNKHGRAAFASASSEWNGEALYGAAATGAAAGAVGAAATHGLDWTGHGANESGGHGDPAEALGAFIAPAHAPHDDHGHGHGHGHGHDQGHGDAHGHDAHGHDDHGHDGGHDAHGHDDHGHDAHGHGAHDQAAHDDHGHGGHDDHGHAAHGHGDHGHGGHDDHGYAAHGHDDHGHAAHGHDHHGHDDHGHGDHGHGDHGHDNHGHDDHGHGHGAHAHDDHHAPAHA